MFVAYKRNGTKAVPYSISRCACRRVRDAAYYEAIVKFCVVAVIPKSPVCALYQTTGRELALDAMLTALCTKGRMIPKIVENTVFSP